MKKINLFIITTLICSIIQAQNKEIVVNINHLYNNEVVNFDSTYLVGENIPIKFDRIEYYIHFNNLLSNQNIATYFSDKYLLVNASQNIYNLGEIELIDDNITSFNFNIGVASDLNHADPSVWETSHPLAPKIPSMHWGWAAGYRFVALEGMIDKNQDNVLETVFQYHPVDDSYYSDTITFNGIVESDDDITIFINANYNKLIENIGADQGGVYHGVHYENRLLINNMVNNQVFTTPNNLHVNHISSLDNIFPNPFSDLIHVNLNQNSKINIYNSIGSLELSYELHKGNHYINTEGLKKGIYIICIRNKSEIKYKKMLKN